MCYTLCWVGSDVAGDKEMVGRTHHWSLMSSLQARQNE
jgi:hypothetical protein